MTIRVASASPSTSSATTSRGLAGLRDLIEKRDQILEDADLAIRDEDQRILHHRFHLLGIGDEIGREKAAVELHALDDIERGLGGLRFFDRDHALAADLVHRIGDEFADRRIVMRGNGADLSLFLARLDRARQRAQRLDRALGRAIEAALDVDRARAGDHVAYAVGEDRVGQDRRGARAVADHFAGLFRRLPQHPRAQILLRVLEVEFLGDRHAIVADDRRAPFLLDQHRFRSRPSVTRTASASCVAPRRIFSRAAERNKICLCAIDGAPLVQRDRDSRS